MSGHPTLRSPLCLLLCAVLSACQSLPPPAREPGPVNDSLRASAANGNPATPANNTASVPAPVLQSLLPPVTRDNETRFDLNVANVDAKAFFLSLVQGSDYNAVVHPDLKGQISLQLKNVSVPEVMRAVRDVYGYEFDQRGNMFLIRPAGLQTHIIPVNYLNLKRSGRSQTRVNSGQIAAASNNNGAGNNASTVSQGGNQPVASIPSTEIETVTETQLWQELQQTLQSLIAGSAGGSVSLNPQAGLAVVRALPEDLRTVREYLAAAQQNLERQVILEAKILEVTLNDGFSAGINWSSAGIVNSDNTLNTSVNGQRLRDDDVLSRIGGVFTGVFKRDDFTAVLDLLATQGTVQVLSSPRVATVNNQKAVLRVGTDEFFVTGISTTTVTGAGSATSSPNVTLTPFFSGIALDVTPQINDSGDITLHVRPSVSEVKDQPKTLTLGEDEFRLPLALSSVREADSIVRARSGQIVVIGGLMQDKRTENNAGMPWLSDIPLLGNLFKQQRDAVAKSELVILLRPVITGDSAWQQQIEDSARRVDELTGVQR